MLLLVAVIFIFIFFKGRQCSVVSTTTTAHLTGLTAGLQSPLLAAASPGGTEWVKPYVSCFPELTVTPQMQVLPLPNMSRLSGFGTKPKVYLQQFYA